MPSSTRARCIMRAAVLVVRVAPATEHHGPEAKRAYLYSRAPKCAVLHGTNLSPVACLPCTWQRAQARSAAPRRVAAGKRGRARRAPFASARPYSSWAMARSAALRSAHRRRRRFQKDVFQTLKPPRRGGRVCAWPSGQPCGRRRAPRRARRRRRGSPRREQRCADGCERHGVRCGCSGAGDPSASSKNGASITRVISTSVGLVKLQPVCLSMVPRQDEEVKDLSRKTVSRQ